MLWRNGAVTIVEAQRALGPPHAYSTVQTRLNRLVKKRLVRRSRSRPSRYSAAVLPEEVTKKDLDLLLTKVTRGVVPLVAHLVNDQALTPHEIQELKSLIASAEARSEETPQDE